MTRHRRWPALPVVAAVLAVLTPAVRAQHDAVALAHTLVHAQAPAVDDPDATALALLDAALRAPRSPVAALLVAEAGLWLGRVQQPARLLAALEADVAPRRHGVLQLELDWLRWRLQRATAGPVAAGPCPRAGHAVELLACGPFGDDGDAFVGVVFAPELQFPDAGAVLPGRGRPATTAVVRARGDSRRIDLARAADGARGVWYGRWRVRVAAPATGLVELEHDGDCQVFVDGREVLRAERWRGTLPARLHAGVDLPAGDHDVVVKTATVGLASVALRLVDAEGHPLAGVTTLPPDAAWTPGAPAVPDPATFVTGEAVLARLAGAADADASLHVAAVLAAVRDGDGDRAIDLAEPLRRTPPDDAAVALAWARVLRLVPLPDELRRAEAHALEEHAAASLLPDHHTARVATAQHHEEQDQREQALRVLAAHPRPGPDTFARRADVLRQLRFTAELPPLLDAWRAACPHDSRPCAQRAHELAPTGATTTVLALRRRSLALRPDQATVAFAACHDALAVGDVAVARELAALAAPPLDAEPTPLALRLELDIALVSGDAPAADAARRALGAHADADVAMLLELAAHHEVAGDVDAARACLQRVLAVHGDRQSVRTRAARLDDRPLPLDELTSRRRDGVAAIAAFTAGAREERSSTTLLLDQQLLVVEPDGSWSTEVHQLRRINDPTGVEELGDGNGLGDVDELLLVRTIDPDGTAAVPARIDDAYSFQRLRPGSFVEWRYRDHGAAPGAAAVDTPPFVFGDTEEPTVLTELVLVLPTGRGELRTRGLGAPDATMTLHDGRTAIVHTRHDVDALPAERFLPSPFVLLPSAQVGEDDTPFAALRDHRVQLGRRARATAPLRAAAERAVAGVTGERARAEAIWSFSQRTVEDGPAGDALTSLLRQQGSRFLVAVALLRAAGLRVETLACRPARRGPGAGDDGLFTTDAGPELPGALLLLDDGTRLPLFVDTPRHWPLGRVPGQRANTVASVVLDGGTEPLFLAGEPNGGQTVAVDGSATVHAQQVAIDVVVTIDDVSGFTLAEQMRQAKDNVRQLAARQIAQQVLGGFRIERAAFAELAPGQPTRLHVAATRGGVQRDGERFVAPLPFAPMQLGATFGDRAERTLPWQLDVDATTTWRIVLDPGPQLQLARVPPSFALVEPPLALTQVLDVADGRVVCRRDLRLTPVVRPAADFAAWRRALAAADRADATTLELVARPGVRGVPDASAPTHGR